MLLIPQMQDCQVGLNFAKQKEAEDFQNAVEEKINQRLNRQGQWRSKVWLKSLNLFGINSQSGLKQPHAFSCFLG